MMNQPISAKQTYCVSTHSGVHFQKTPEFSHELANFSLNFSETNQDNQEEELERQIGHNVNKNTLKSIETWLNVFDDWQGQCRAAKKMIADLNYIINK